MPSYLKNSNIKSYYSVKALVTRPGPVTPVHSVNSTNLFRFTALLRPRKALVVKIKPQEQCNSQLNRRSKSVHLPYHISHLPSPGCLQLSLMSIPYIFRATDNSSRLIMSKHVCNLNLKLKYASLLSQGTNNTFQKTFPKCERRQLNGG